MAGEAETTRATSLANYALFDRLAEGGGGRVAIRFGERAYRYDEVAERGRALASYLARAGVRREQRVLLVLPDVPPFAWSFFGALACGGVVVMGNPAARPGELRTIIEHARPAAVIATPEVVAATWSALEATRDLRAVLLAPSAATGADPEDEVAPPGLGESPRFPIAPLRRAIDEGSARPEPPCELRPDDPAIWLLTSGSTGRPKAAVHAHLDLIAHTEAYARRTLGYRPDDVTISVPRLFFGYATGANLIFPLAAGASVGLFSEPPTPERLARAIADYRPTIVTNLPTMLSKLLERDDELRAGGRPGLDLSGGRFHISAGEALPAALHDRFTSRFSVPIYDGIGSAETFHIYATNRPGDVRPGSLGRAVEGYELAILPPGARGPGAPELSRGEVGVLWVRGPGVAREYAGDREASGSTFFGAWCKTGDRCRLDEDGYLHYEGRADSLFKAGGVWVAPAEVEACLAAHEAVAEAAVIPRRRDGLLKPEARVVLSRRVRARVASDRDREALAEELRAHVREKLGAQKHPRRIHFVDELPRSDRGKLDRAALAEEDAS